MLRERAQEARPRHHRRRGARAGGAGLAQPEGRRLLQELHGRVEDRVAGHHAAQRRAGGDREDQRQEGPAGGVRPRGAGRRAAALLGQCRRRPAQLRSHTPCRSRSRDSACPIATTTCATTRSSPRPARRMRPTSRGSSRSATSPIPKAPRRASSRSRPRSPSCSGTARATAIATPPTTRWASPRCRRRRRTSTGRRTCRRCRPARRTRSSEVIVRQPDYMKAIDAVIDDVPLATWKEYLTFGLISAYADGLSAPFADSRLRVQRQGPRRTPGAAAAMEARRQRSRAGARRTGRPPLHRAAFQAGSEGAHGRADPQPARGVQGRHRRARVDVAGNQAPGAGQARQVPLEDRVSRSVARLLDARGQAGRSHRQPAPLPRSSRTTIRGRGSASRSSAGAGASRRRPSTRSYSATNNEITFPAGILQPPFFDLDADDAINYGAIGAVIGHEISHGFDDQGRKSDGDGNLRDWWTAEDAKKFDERAAKLGAQFESYNAAARHEDQRPPDDGREHRRLERHRGRAIAPTRSR